MKRRFLRLAGTATILAAVVLAAPRPADAWTPTETDPCLVTPCIRIDDIHCFEGQWCLATVYVSVPVREPVTVHLRTVDGTAVTPDDYEPIRDGTLTIEPGSTSAAAAIQIVADRLPEPDEEFLVVIFDAIGGIVSDGQATVVIPGTR
jgi:hypothetical protein